MGTIIFLSVLIVFLSLLLIIDISFCWDINKMKIQVVIKIYKLRIIKIDILPILLIFKINNGKYKKLNLILKRDEKYLISQIKNNILNKLYYDTVSADFIIQLLDPSRTAIAVGVINNFLEISKYILLSNNEDIDVSLNCRTNFQQLNNKVSFNIKVYFTIFDMVYAIILSFYKRGKYVKEKR